ERRPRGRRILLLDDRVRAAVAVEAGRSGGRALLAHPLAVDGSGPVGHLRFVAAAAGCDGRGSGALRGDRLLGRGGRRRRGAVQIEVEAAVAVGALELRVDRAGERLCVEQRRGMARETTAVGGRCCTGGEKQKRRREEEEAHAPRNCNRCAPPGSRAKAQDLRTKILRRSSYRGLACGSATFSRPDSEAVATRCPRPLAAAAPATAKTAEVASTPRSDPNATSPRAKMCPGSGAPKMPVARSRPAYPP